MSLGVEARSRSRWGDPSPPKPGGMDLRLTARFLLSTLCLPLFFLTTNSDLFCAVPSITEPQSDLEPLGTFPFQQQQGEHRDVSSPLVVVQYKVQGPAAQTVMWITRLKEFSFGEREAEREYDQSL